MYVRMVEKLFYCSKICIAITILDLSQKLRPFRLSTNYNYQALWLLQQPYIQKPSIFLLFSLANDFSWLLPFHSQTPNFFFFYIFACLLFISTPTYAHFLALAPNASDSALLVCSAIYSLVRFCKRLSGSKPLSTSLFQIAFPLLFQTSQFEHFLPSNSFRHVLAQVSRFNTLVPILPFILLIFKASATMNF